MPPHSRNLPNRLSLSYLLLNRTSLSKGLRLTLGQVGEEVEGQRVLQVLSVLWVLQAPLVLLEPVLRELRGQVLREPLGQAQQAQLELRELLEVELQEQRELLEVELQEQRERLEPQERQDQRLPAPES